MNPLDQQVAGNHYKNMGIQPMEFSVKNRWDAAAHTALKYVSRFKEKAGKVDLEKAIHCLQLRYVLHPTDPLVDSLVQYLYPTGDSASLRRRTTAARGEPEIRMVAYAASNGYDGLHAAALYRLEAFVEAGDRLTYLEAVEAIRDLIAAEYPTNE